MVLALCDILENTKNLNHLSISDIIHKDFIRLNKVCDKLKLLHLLSVSIYLLSFSFMDSTILINIHTLNIGYLKLNSDDIRLLCGVLRQLKSLCCLTLSYNGIGDTGAVALAKVPKDCTSLTELDISHNFITPVGMSALAPVIRANSIQHLNVSGNEIDCLCDDLLLAIVDCRDTLQSLNIENIMWKERIFKDGLKKMKHLVNLNISDSAIGSQIAFAEGLKCCSQLVKLNISGNGIGSQGIVFLSESTIKCWSQLVKLNISDCAIGSEGIGSLAVKLYCSNL